MPRPIEILEDGAEVYDHPVPGSVSQSDGTYVKRKLPVLTQQRGSLDAPLFYRRRPSQPPTPMSNRSEPIDREVFYPELQPLSKEPDKGGADLPVYPTNHNGNTQGRGWTSPEAVVVAKRKAIPSMSKEVDDPKSYWSTVRTDRTLPSGDGEERSSAIDRFFKKARESITRIRRLLPLVGVLTLASNRPLFTSHPYDAIEKLRAGRQVIVTSEMLPMDAKVSVALVPRDNAGEIHGVRSQGRDVEAIVAGLPPNINSSLVEDRKIS